MKYRLVEIHPTRGVTVRDLPREREDGEVVMRTWGYGYFPCTEPASVSVERLRKFLVCALLDELQALNEMDYTI